MRIQIYDREEVEAGIRVVEPYILISIRDPFERKVRIPKTSMVIDQLRLTFDDAEPYADFRPTIPTVFMADHHADKIWQFLEQNLGRSQLLAVHCEQGVSRSPGAGMAIAESAGLPTDQFTREYQPNMFVRQLVTEAFDRLPKYNQTELAEWLSGSAC